MTTIVRYGIIILLLLITTISNVYAQTKEAIQVLEKLQESYASDKGYDITMTYTLYKGFDGNQITEQYQGTLYKQGTTFIMKALGMEALQFQEGILRIDHESRKIYYSQQPGQVQNPADVSKILQFFKPVSFHNEQGISIVAMELKTSQLPIPFQKIILHFDQQKNALIKQVLFFAEKKPFMTKEGNKEYDTARVEIELQENTKRSSDNPAKFSDYVIRNGNTLTLTDLYNNYTLINQTNP